MRDLRRLETAADHRILVLAPHPDDFEVVAATLQFFRGIGARIDLAVLTGSANGVEDSFCSPPTDEHKARLREAEQREGCRLFGLADEHLRFLRLTEDEEGHPVESEESIAAVAEHFAVVSPTIVFLPHPQDTNAGHRRTYRMFATVAERTGAAVVAFLNEDPKTVDMQPEVFLEFGEETAEWKAELLRCHRSQHQRNLNVRGYGLDERILRMNRAAAELLATDSPYAEVFAIECRGGASLEL